MILDIRALALLIPQLDESFGTTCLASQANAAQLSEARAPGAQWGAVMMRPLSLVT